MKGLCCFFFFQAEDGIRDYKVTGVQTCALPISGGGELLRSFELLGTEILRLQGNEHEKIWFDCKNFRSLRIEELQIAARTAAENVRRTGNPYRFGPMSSRERRIVHLALRDEKDLRTESDGEGGRRSVVVYPGNYKSPAKSEDARHHRQERY